MKAKTLTARETRERKALLQVPVFLIPVMTLLFWLLGGGHTRAAFGKAGGFKMTVPIAHVPSIVKLDKTGYYEQAKRDSAAARQRARMESSYAKVLGLDSVHTPDAMAQVVQAKLEQVKKVLAGQGMGALAPAAVRAGMAAVRPALGEARPQWRSGQGNSDVGRFMRADAQPDLALQRLERVVSALQHNDGGGAELTGLTSALEKLTGFQGARHDTVQRRVGQTAKRAVLMIKALPDDSRGLDSSRDPRQAASPGSFDSSAIEAVVPEEQVLTTGAELKLELTCDILVDGRRIPAGTPVYGIVSLSGERLRVAVGSITWQDRVFPVELKVDDEDGLAGIYVPGAPVNDAVRESTASEIGAVGPTVVSTGLVGQAADAGMAVAREVIGKKVRPVRVTVPAGYHVLLHPKTEGQ